MRGKPQTFQLGEIPTVQERFQAVVKRRLQVEIQNHPPLFPWESQLIDYPEFVEESSIALVPAWGWLAQQSKLNLPVSLPDKIFQQLMEKCQLLLTSSLPLGPKLVQAVESIFPEDYQLINDLAGLVLRSSYRSVDALETIPHIQSDYSDLQPRQQMALSLIAAKQLLENLTLPISFTNPVIEKQWQTNSGTLSIRVELQALGKQTKLCVHGELPTSGVLKLHENSTPGIGSTSAGGNAFGAGQVLATSANLAKPSVELYCERVNKTYTLAVECPEIEEQPLLLAINLMMSS
ncbi:PatU [Sphaerospermopsis aphanizomenoides BCCUSP55]|uniref:PatU n=1 Tax=Sphaerospermopsis aphanizomenoides TaxID=459663 RepID=UPI000ACC6023|nr:PatU [Sphaerospermopsis aphanizomenoides]MBK1986884.1 PatU [Sphaerospermopsis aphanizomenoides BCCUSP55]